MLLQYTTVQAVRYSTTYDNRQLHTTSQTGKQVLLLHVCNLSSAASQTYHRARGPLEEEILLGQAL